MTSSVRTWLNATRIDAATTDDLQMCLGQKISGKTVLLSFPTVPSRVGIKKTQPKKTKIKHEKIPPELGFFLPFFIVNHLVDYLKTLNISMHLNQYESYVKNLSL